jgi:hypothetical protein
MEDNTTIVNNTNVQVVGPNPLDTKLQITMSVMSAAVGIVSAIFYGRQALENINVLKNAQQ